jgi:transitional endoplasmic reticulum ATPase
LAGDDNVRVLRDALAHSPDNVPLRKHLAETLLGFGRADEAEVKFREALARDRDSVELKLGLARAFQQQGKLSHAIVIVEEMIRQRDTPAAAYLLHSRLLLQQGDVEFAVSEYRQAVREDESLRDEAFAANLGIDAGESSEVVDGKVRAAWDGDEEPTRPSRIRSSDRRSTSRLSGAWMPSRKRSA